MKMSGGIPRKIHLIYASKTIPERYSEYAGVMYDLHPGWEITVWDDETALAMTGKYFPQLAPVYSSYPLTVQRTDIFRVMLMYVEGGFYLDLDMLCMRSLDELCGAGLVLGTEKVLPEDQRVRLGHRFSVRIANYMFGSRPGHAFWLDVLLTAAARASSPITDESGVLESTGPGLLTDVYHENAYKYQDITLLKNEHLACRRSCGPASCHFGDFAAHLHMGSWRWESTGKSN